MLMKWEDLEPGDVVKLSKKFYKNLDRQYKEIFIKYIDKDLIVRSIEKKGGYGIIIAFMDIELLSVDINYDGSFWDYKVYISTPVFEIVRLSNV